MGQVAFTEQEVSPGERATQRMRLMLAASVQDAEGRWNPAMIYDLSETGLLLECGREFAQNASLKLEHPQLGTCGIQIVWFSGSFYGCQFERPLNSGLVASAYRTSKVVWPSFQDQGPQHRQQSEDEQPGEAEQAGEAKGRSLGVGTKLLIIVGFSLALWTGALAAVSAI